MRIELKDENQEEPQKIDENDIRYKHETDLTKKEKRELEKMKLASMGWKGSSQRRSGKMWSISPNWMDVFQRGYYLTKWKANGNGVDLNRNFDALWDVYQDPAGHPSADHYKGTEPGCEAESAALISLTREQQFSRTISYHTQGGVIYWYFAQEGELYEKSLDFGERISHLTGYDLDGNYEDLDPAGYKDWAISAEKNSQSDH